MLLHAEFKKFVADTAIDGIAQVLAEDKEKIKNNQSKLLENNCSYLLTSNLIGRKISLDICWLISLLLNCRDCCAIAGYCMSLNYIDVLESEASKLICVFCSSSPQIHNIYFI